MSFARSTSWDTGVSFDEETFLKLPQGLKDSVTQRAFRGPRCDYPAPVDEYAMFTNDGADAPVRVKMQPATPCKGAHWAVHRNEVAFRWAILPPGPYEDGHPWSWTWGGGGVGFTLRFGQGFFRDNRQRWSPRTMAWGTEHDLYRLLSADMKSGLLQVVKITETILGGVDRDLFEVPIAKFVEDYSPPQNYKEDAMRKWKLAVIRARIEGRPEPDYPDEPPSIKPTFSLYTVVKIRRQFLPLLERARHTIHKPGGSGFKRARESFESRAQEGKSEDALVGELLADRDAFFNDADWEWLNDQHRDTTDGVAVNTPYMQLVAQRLQCIRERATAEAGPSGV